MGVLLPAAERFSWQAACRLCPLQGGVRYLRARLKNSFQLAHEPRLFVTWRREMLLAVTFISCAFSERVHAQPTERTPGASESIGKSGIQSILLKKVTFEKVHQYESGYPRVNSLINASPDWLRPLLPSELEDKVTSPTFSWSQSLDVLMVWFNRKNNRTATASPLDDLIKIVAFDDHGCNFESHDIGEIGKDYR